MRWPAVSAGFQLSYLNGVPSGTPFIDSFIDSGLYGEAVLTYYSDPTVEVTSVAINIYGHVFALAELGDVWHREAGPGPDGVRRKGREIWAIWRGKELMLLHISDETRFGQVYRAIQRALGD